MRKPSLFILEVSKPGERPLKLPFTSEQVYMDTIRALRTLKQTRPELIINHGPAYTKFTTVKDAISTVEFWMR